MRITGVILAGGKSSRYGRNKTLETFEGERLIDRSVGFLRSLTHPVFVVANDLSPYRGVQARLLQDVVPQQGPLGGIHTALLSSPNHWIFARAADMPFFVPALFSLLAQHADDRFDVVVPRLNGFYEPLLAFYSRRCIPAVAEALRRHERRIVAPFRNLRVKEVTSDEWRKIDPEGLSFKNINTPEEMGRLCLA